MSGNREHYDRFWLVVGREPGNSKPLVLDEVFHSNADACAAATLAAAATCEKRTVFVVMQTGEAYEGRPPTTERVFLDIPPCIAPPPMPAAKSEAQR